MDHAALLDWIATPDQPAARYLAARDLTGAGDAELRRRREAMLAWAPLRRIVALQQDDGRFPAHEKQPTLGNTFTALRLMELCGMDLRDEPVARVLARIEAGHIDAGAISYKTGGSGILPCYSALVARALARMGGGDSVAVRATLDWLVRHQRFDHRGGRAGGDEPWSFRAVVHYGCWQSVSCYHGVVAALGALVTVPASRRTPHQRARIDAALDYLRAHRVYKRSTEDRPIFRTSTRFYLFHGYRPHLLDALEWIAEADPTLGDAPWVRGALDDVAALAPDGRVVLSTNARTHLIDPLPFEPLGEPSRLLTLQWLRIRRRFGLLEG